MNQLQDLRINIPFIQTDINQDVQYVSPTFCEKFSITKQQLVGENINKIIKRNIQGKNESVYFSKIFGQACLIKRDRVEDTYIYQVLITENEVNMNAIISFLNSIKSKENYKKTSIQTNYQIDDIIGDSPAINRIKELASKIAMSNSTVLLSGESGTGKEMFAQAIHNLSTRRNFPFVAVNCVAIPDELFESELFGYEAGAFSGARREGKPGKFELAQNGTIFLDEISELSYISQGKLLRVLQEKEVERLGGTKKTKIDTRIIAATNKDLAELVKEGKFRQDLYYRIYVFDLHIPPLRNRKEDIIPLAHAFIKEFNEKLGKNVIYIDSNLEKWFLEYDWPGNVRELKASIERGMNIVDGDTLTLDVLYFNSQNDISSNSANNTSQFTYNSLDEAVRDAEIRAIKHALKEVHGDRVLAAQKLKIHVASLYRKISKYNLNV